MLLFEFCCGVVAPPPLQALPRKPHSVALRQKQQGVT